VGDYDAIVVGSGPNGLVAANVLADDGWNVLVVEAQLQPGGGLRSSELVERGFVHDHCSSFHPMMLLSPAMRAMQLERYGLQLRHSELALVHPSVDGPSALISRDLDETVDALGVDGEAWRRLYAMWQQLGDDLLSSVFRPFPPVRPAARLAWTLRGRELLRFRRFSLLPVRRLGDEQFQTDAARRLLAGVALHGDFLVESAGSGAFGWALACMAQQAVASALIRRLESKGGAVVCGQAVTRIAVRNGRAVGVETSDGSVFSARRAVLADVDAVALYLQLLDERHVPSHVRRDIVRFERDSAVVKVDWTLHGEIPWSDPAVGRAATVHIADSLDHLSRAAGQIARGVVPDDPFLLLGQYARTDPTRQPDGTETVWSYTHVPRGLPADEALRVADRMQAAVERLAPGFDGQIRTRRVGDPASMEMSDANLVDGAIGGGTAQAHQQFVFRPLPGLARAETAIAGLYLASSSAHPGAGVHGACGANAARAALWHEQHRMTSRMLRTLARRADRGRSIVP
jgi:phytoene dehydrogenase-like protein